MAKILRWSIRLGGYGLAGLIILVAVAITFTVGWRPVVGARSRPLREKTFEHTPERLQRGQYLTESVAGCFACHSNWDEKSFEVPVMTSKKGAGRIFPPEGGLQIVAPNLTPDQQTGLGSASDDAIARAIREGIGHDGRAMFPMMPYQGYRHMSDEDVAAVVAYLRTLEPVHSELPKMKLPFPLHQLVNLFPEPITGAAPQPDLATPVARGEYLVQLAGCADCHSPRGGPPADFGPIKGLEFSGGNEFGDQGTASANLTPDPSGISYYDEALFIKTIRSGHVGARKLSSEMPWWVYRNMTDSDLASIFAYLRTLKPVHHRVDNTEPPTKCKICGHVHGAGASN